MVLSYQRLSLLSEKEIRIVSLGTGTKCRGILSYGALNDSHAEVIARRGFIAFVYKELEKMITFKSASDYFEFRNEKVSLKEYVKFHFFISDYPCGDGAIYPLLNRDDDESHHRTGAKCVIKSDCSNDSNKEGHHYNRMTVEQLRTKPGRGFPSASMSCSDKLLKWNFVGIQGALLMTFLDKPIYLSSVIVSSLIHSTETLKRAIWLRASDLLSNELNVKCPEILFSSILFENGQWSVVTSSKPLKSCAVSSSICLYACTVDKFKHFVTVNGYNQGFTNKNKINKLCIPLISKVNFFIRFHRVLSSLRCFSTEITDCQKRTRFPSHFTCPLEKQFDSYKKNLSRSETLRNAAVEGIVMSDAYLRRFRGLSYSACKLKIESYRKLLLQFLDFFPLWVHSPKENENFFYAQ